MKPRTISPTFSKNMLKIAAFACLGGAFGIPAAYAEPLQAVAPVQTGTITGVVVDAEGEPLIGATVLIKGTTNGTATDIDGRFTLKATAGQELQISYVGYQTLTLKIQSGKFNLGNVVLASDSQNLDDVVVIGYGTQRKGDVTSAVAQVRAEDFSVGNNNNAGDLIKGKVAGLTITKSSGDPGANSEISLRGIVTVSGNAAPLVLIDGVPGDLTTVPPENIETIDVLKDASAAAIYGTRGAAGVILITTKSGKREQNTTVTYSGYVSFSKWSKKADFMDASDIRAGKTNYNDEGYDTDWLEAISRTAVTNNHSVSITGGNQSTSYYGNFTYRKAEGVMKKTGNEKIAMSFDVSHWMLNDMLKVNLNLVADSYNYDRNNTTAVYRQAVIRNPTSPIWNEDGSYNEGILLQYYNPVSLQNEYTGESKDLNMRMTGNITFEPIKGWQTNLMLATDRHKGTSKEYQSKDYTLNDLNGFDGTASIQEWSDQTNYLEITSKYRNTFNDVHRFEGLVGFSWSENIWDNSSMWNANFPNDYFLWNSIQTGSYLTDGKASMGSDKGSSKLIGWFGRVSYGYDNRYNILASIRYEGSSKFGKNNKWGAFPSVSAGWNIMNEAFMENTRDWMNNLKLRAGFGITGVIPGESYRSILRYAYDADSFYYRNGKWQNSLKPVSNANPDLKWEKANEVNVGIDFGFLNDRIGGSIDWYYKTTSDMLYDYSVPSPPNLFDETYANVGKMRNTGIEVMVRAIPVTTKDFEWNTVATFQHNANKLVSLSNDLYQTENTMWLMGIGDPISQYTHKVQVGEEFGQIWGLKAVGVSENGVFLIENPQTGQCAEFYQEMRNDTDNWYQYLGNGLPKFNIGWNNQFRYRDFDLSMQFTGAFGFKIVNNQRVFYENNAHAYNKLRAAAEPVMGDRKLSALQGQAVTSYYVENGDYFKLSNIQLGYTIPFKNNKWIKSLRVYGSIDNVFTITKYKGIDPELNVENFWTAGVDDRDKYPTIRSFSIGLNATF